MKYMGSKNRISKHILPFIVKELGGKSVYWEPFVGGGNMIDKIPDSIKKIGSDYDSDAINGLLTIKNKLESIPKNKNEFNEYCYKEQKNIESVFSGYVAYALSYGGKKWGGWRRDSSGNRDYVAEAYRNAVKQSDKLKNVDLLCRSYDSLNIENAVIYCDPPYKGTTNYSSYFNHDKFYDWCILQSEKGNKVFVSEYSMPDMFDCLWEKEISSSLTKNTGSKTGIERLYTIN